MTVQREQFGFGQGIVGPALNNPEVSELPVIEQAKILGWTVACPVVNALVDPENLSPGRGPEAMLRRYAEVGFWFGYTAQTALETNPDLYVHLISSVYREGDESVGTHEPESVPVAYFNEIPPTATLPGYALPRLFIKQLGENSSDEESQSRQARGLQVLHESILKAETPYELLALVADGLSKAYVPSKEVLSAILPQSWFDEHNASHMLDKTKAAIQENAPDLWQTYEKMTAAEKSELKIL